MLILSTFPFDHCMTNATEPRAQEFWSAFGLVLAHRGIKLFFCILGFSRSNAILLNDTLPIQDPAVLHLISSVWLKFCIHGYSHPSSPCSFSLSIPVHGKLQPGFYLRKEPYHRLIRELFIKELNKRRSDVPDIVDTAEIFKDEKEMEMLESFYGLRPNDKICNESEREAPSAFTNSWHGVENAEK